MLPMMDACRYCHVCGLIGPPVISRLVRSQFVWGIICPKSGGRLSTSPEATAQPEGSVHTPPLLVRTASLIRLGQSASDASRCPASVRHATRRDHTALDDVKGLAVVPSPSSRPACARISPAVL